MLHCVHLWLGPQGFHAPRSHRPHRTTTTSSVNAVRILSPTPVISALGASWCALSPLLSALSLSFGLKWSPIDPPARVGGFDLFLPRCPRATVSAAAAFVLLWLRSRRSSSSQTHPPVGVASLDHSDRKTACKYKLIQGTLCLYKPYFVCMTLDTISRTLGHWTTRIL